MSRSFYMFVVYTTVAHHYQHWLWTIWFNAEMKSCRTSHVKITLYWYIPAVKAGLHTSNTEWSSYGADKY